MSDGNHDAVEPVAAPEPVVEAEPTVETVDDAQAEFLEFKSEVTEYARSVADEEESTSTNDPEPDVVEDLATDGDEVEPDGDEAVETTPVDADEPVAVVAEFNDDVLAAAFVAGIDADRAKSFADPDLLLDHLEALAYKKAAQGDTTLMQAYGMELPGTAPKAEPAADVPQILEDLSLEWNHTDADSDFDKELTENVGKVYNHLNKQFSTKFDEMTQVVGALVQQLNQTVVSQQFDHAIDFLSDDHKSQLGSGPSWTLDPNSSEAKNRSDLLKSLETVIKTNQGISIQDAISRAALLKFGTINQEKIASDVKGEIRKKANKRAGQATRKPVSRAAPVPAVSSEDELVANAVNKVKELHEEWGIS